MNSITAVMNWRCWRAGNISEPVHGPCVPQDGAAASAAYKRLAGKTLERAGFAYRQDIVELLHIRPKQCTLVLRHLVQAGELVQQGQKYYLPQDEKRKVE